MSGREYKRSFWCDGSILYLVWGWDIGYASPYVCQKSSNGTLKICAFHFMSLRLIKKKKLEKQMSFEVMGI